MITLLLVSGCYMFLKITRFFSILKTSDWKCPVARLPKSALLLSPAMKDARSLSLSALSPREIGCFRGSSQGVAGIPHTCMPGMQLSAQHLVAFPKQFLKERMGKSVRALFYSTQLGFVFFLWRLRVRTLSSPRSCVILHICTHILMARQRDIKIRQCFHTVHLAGCPARFWHL